VIPVSTALPQIKSGKVRPLAVLTDKRIATLPSVPTGIEAGVPTFTMPLWYGMFAPAATPKDMISRLEHEMIRALQSKDIADKLTAAGADPWPGTADQLRDLLKTEIDRYGAVVWAAKIPKQ
jgi:tripartite-type tricarboxylate transporter receptor subunit TctC